MLNFNSIPFNPRIDFIILNMKNIQSLVDRVNNSGRKYQFENKLESEFYYALSILIRGNFNSKLERFLTNCEKVGFTYDFELETLPDIKKVIELVVTQDDVDNFSWRNKYSLNHLLIALCFMDRSIDLLFIQQDPAAIEPNFHLIQEDLNEAQCAIRYLIQALITTSFISQEARQLTTVFLWGMV